MTGISQAHEAILIPGAMPFKGINPAYPMVAAAYPTIGQHFHGDPAPQLIDYSQNPLAANAGLRDGVAQARIAVLQTNGKVVVIGESMGAMVAWRLAAELADTPGAPSRDDLSVVLVAPPEMGVAEYFREGTIIAALKYRVRRVNASPYDTTIVIGQYDGWSDPPDRPWNLISFANSILAIHYVHGPPSFTADVSGLTCESYTPGNAEHGSVTRYLVPAENLPLTQVFRDIGVPDVLVDKADRLLRPIVDAGYIRHDKPGDTRRYLYDGEIHRNVGSEPQARASILRKLRDLLAAGIGVLKKRIAERLKPSQERGT